MIQISRKDVIKDMKRISKQVKTLTRRAYRAKGSYSSWTVEQRFGNFTKALRAAKIRNVA